MSSTEYGVFTDEGCVFVSYSLAEATEYAKELLTEGSYEAADISTQEVCPDHDEQPRGSCEECFEEEDDSEPDEDDED